jgi:hypothetical protein
MQMDELLGKNGLKQFSFSRHHKATLAQLCNAAIKT